MTATLEFGRPEAVAGRAALAALAAREMRRFVLFLVLYGWVSLVTILSFSHPDSAPVAVLRLFAPFAYFTYAGNAVGVTAWRGSPWFFIGWQLALCAIAVLVALLRGAEGRGRTRVIRALAIAGAAAVIMLVLAAAGGFTHAVTA
jgi:hypothetical protein